MGKILTSYIAVVTINWLIDGGASCERNKRISFYRPECTLFILGLINGRKGEKLKFFNFLFRILMQKMFVGNKRLYGWWWWYPVHKQSPPRFLLLKQLVISSWLFSRAMSKNLWQLPNFDFVCFRCICNPGYTGKNCESEYIPCNPSPCKNDGLCRQIDSLTYECKCPTGM